MESIIDHETTEAVELQDIPQIPTPEEASIEARALVMKLIFFPEIVTLLELARLQEILIAEGYMED